ncbi:helix-turn-helix domain-containing protein [Clostridium perfringens]|uniref:helix-turn-helix domain-containing protein n=1 Tax=Clostridium perfringens TaxID=1502 RepID=UPI0037553A30
MFKNINNNKEEANLKSFIQLRGILSHGYGFSPQIVMRDIRLTAEAKAIYSYMASFAGTNLTAFPTIELQLHELNMSAKRYYKHRKLLEDLGYITIQRTTTKLASGKVVRDKNIYILEQFPVEKNKYNTDNDNSKKEIKSNNLAIVQKVQVQKCTSKNNNIKSNNFNINNISSSNKEDIEEEVKIVSDICKENNFKLSIKDIKNILLAFPVSKLIKAILTATTVNTKINNCKGYIMAILKDMDIPKNINIIAKNNDNINKNKLPNPNAHNFTQREYDFDSLEKQLLGWA